MESELYAIFKGKVQGVGFRYTVLEKAEKFHLVGNVKNLPNGSVELFAQGPKENLEAFLNALKEDASPAQITSVETRFSKPIKKFTEFKIIH